ncbi:unnamed protein product [Haemonchus placei]|uniref:C-type lectin domain-containing protein n=1 Tax=Haemonchus placei TaxID=6290 RepID=A0A0N4X7Y9_HAEPC|nr:unnamed protein product [Haemonchus placei]
MLKNLASKNYNLVNYEKGKQLYAQDLRQLLCEANCFCKKKWVPYNNDQWNAPQGGCYYPLMIPSIQTIKGAFRAQTAKEISWTANFPARSLDSTKIGRFTKWAKGHPNTNKGECVYMQQYSDSKSAWYSDDCYNDHYYICQTKPCDSSKYCAAGLGNDDSDS